MRANEAQRTATELQDELSTVIAVAPADAMPGGMKKPAILASYLILGFFVNVARIADAACAIANHVARDDNGGL